MHEAQAHEPSPWSRCTRQSSWLGSWHRPQLSSWLDAVVPECCIVSPVVSRNPFRHLDSGTAPIPCQDFRATYLAHATIDTADQLEQCTAMGKLQDCKTDAERELLTETLRQTGGNVAESARRLGENPRNLWHRIRYHEIDLTGFRKGT